jgi:hypothetical protein
MKFKVSLYRLARIHTVEVESQSAGEAFDFGMTLIKAFAERHGYKLPGLSVRVQREDGTVVKRVML